MQLIAHSDSDLQPNLPTPRTCTVQWHRPRQLNLAMWSFFIQTFARTSPHYRFTVRAHGWLSVQNSPHNIANRSICSMGGHLTVRGLQFVGHIFSECCHCHCHCHCHCACRSALDWMIVSPRKLEWTVDKRTALNRGSSHRERCAAGGTRRIQ